MTRYVVQLPGCFPSASCLSQEKARGSSAVHSSLPAKYLFPWLCITYSYGLQLLHQNSPVRTFVLQLTELTGLKGPNNKALRVQ